MQFVTCKTLLRAALAVTTLWAAGAHASFIAAIDELVVARNGVTIFTDPFSDGTPPPSAPPFAGGNPASYAVLGTTPQPEIGGKYIMDSTLGGYTLAGDGTARLRGAVRPLPAGQQLQPRGRCAGGGGPPRLRRVAPTALRRTLTRARRAFTSRPAAVEPSREPVMSAVTGSRVAWLRRTLPQALAGLRGRRHELNRDTMFSLL